MINPIQIMISLLFCNLYSCFSIAELVLGVSMGSPSSIISRILPSTCNQPMMKVSIILYSLSHPYSSSLFPTATQEPSHLSRMQSIRRSFRQSLKRLNVRQSMRGMQSIRRSYRPNFVRSNSMRPSMKNKAYSGGVAGMGGASAFGGGAGVAGAPGSAEVTPVPIRRDSIRHISFAAPCHIAGESFNITRS